MKLKVEANNTSTLALLLLNKYSFVSVKIRILLKDFLTIWILGFCIKNRNIIEGFSELLVLTVFLAGMKAHGILLKRESGKSLAIMLVFVVAFTRHMQA